MDLHDKTRADVRIDQVKHPPQPIVEPYVPPPTPDQRLYLFSIPVDPVTDEKMKEN